jgi:hypothetical protein
LRAHGKPGDHPVTDTIVYGKHPYPPNLEKLVIELYKLDSQAFNVLEWEPFKWKKGEHISEAMVLLRGLIENHGNPIVRRELITDYGKKTKDR